MKKGHLKLDILFAIISLSFGGGGIDRSGLGAVRVIRLLYTAHCTPVGSICLTGPIISPNYNRVICFLSVTSLAPLLHPFTFCHISWYHFLFTSMTFSGALWKTDWKSNFHFHPFLELPKHWHVLFAESPWPTDEVSLAYNIFTFQTLVFTPLCRMQFRAQDGSLQCECIRVVT